MQLMIKVTIFCVITLQVQKYEWRKTHVADKKSFQVFHVEEHKDVSKKIFFLYKYALPS